MISLVEKCVQLWRIMVLLMGVCGRVVRGVCGRGGDGGWWGEKYVTFMLNADALKGFHIVCL